MGRKLSGPRVIYLEACAEIAESFASLGFRYRRSKPSLVRRGGDFLHEILFHSSHCNIIIPASEHDNLMQAFQFYGEKHGLSLTPELIDTTVQSSVALQITITIRSSLMKEWRLRQSLPLRRDDYVAGDEVGRLRLPSCPAYFDPGPIYRAALRPRFCCRRWRCRFSTYSAGATIWSRGWWKKTFRDFGKLPHLNMSCALAVGIRVSRY